MSHGEFTRAAARPSASAAGRWRSHDARPSRTRDGSGDTLKQHLWGARYVDDLVQIAVNDDPPSRRPLPASPRLRRTSRRAGPTDANPDASGLVERYEYTPGVHPPRRGHRTVYKKAGIDDELTTAPLYHSQGVVADGDTKPYGLCDVGHQGLMHDEQFGLVYNRNRYLDPRTGRWPQRDPAGYADGLNVYLYLAARPSSGTDPKGLWEYIGVYKYKAERNFERLEDLALAAGGSRGDWRCIWRAPYTDRHGRPYWENICKDDVYDARNIQKYTGGYPSIFVHVGTDWHNQMYCKDRSGEVFVNPLVLDRYFRTKSGEGRTPILLFELFGHGTRTLPVLWGDGAFGFWPRRFDRNGPAVTWERARAQRGPRRCWFSTIATGWGIMCGGQAFGRAFADTYLKSSGTITVPTDSLWIREDRDWWGLGNPDWGIGHELVAPRARWLVAPNNGPFVWHPNLDDLIHRSPWLQTFNGPAD